MTEVHIRVIEDGAVTTVQLDRPERRNALTVADRNALRNALEHADADPQVRVVVITGSAAHFCAGGDIAEFAVERTPDEAYRYASTIAQSVFRSLRAMSTPTVARVRGAAAGAGMYLALGCDIVIADESAYFHPGHLDLAVIPDWGAVWLMPRLVGMARAKAVTLTGRRIPAPTAAAWGLIAECVDPNQLDDTVADYCQRIAAVPTHVMALARRGLDASLDTTLPDFLEWEAAAIAATMPRPEHRERVRAFLDGTAARGGGQRPS